MHMIFLLKCLFFPGWDSVNVRDDIKILLQPVLLVPFSQSNSVFFYSMWGIGRYLCFTGIALLFLV